MKANVVEVDGKKFQKTAQWGNRKLRVVFKNRKKYNRKSFKKELCEA